MSEHIKDQVIKQAKSSGPFALQLDELRMFRLFGQLTTFVRYIYSGEFKNECLCIANLPPTTP